MDACLRRAHSLGQLVDLQLLFELLQTKPLCRLDVLDLPLLVDGHLDQAADPVCVVYEPSVGFKTVNVEVERDLEEVSLLLKDSLSGLFQILRFTLLVHFEVRLAVGPGLMMRELGLQIFFTVDIFINYKTLQLFVLNFKLSQT